jgi:flavin-dependent dehydrogenase
VRRFTGKNIICTGEAHRFVDPIFSFGLYATMKEALFAAEAIKHYFGGVGRDLPNPFAKHQMKCESGLDVFEDMIDTFWEHPLAFALFLHHRYNEQVIDIFAGRVFGGEVTQAMLGMRKLLARERLEESADDESIPVGSRYHPERASLWETELPAGLEELLAVN